jgi:hypothetical protein
LDFPTSFPHNYNETSQLFNKFRVVIDSPLVCHFHYSGQFSICTLNNWLNIIWVIISYLFKVPLCTGDDDEHLMMRSISLLTSSFHELADGERNRTGCRENWIFFSFQALPASSSTCFQFYISHTVHCNWIQSEMSRETNKKWFFMEFFLFFFLLGYEI